MRTFTYKGKTLQVVEEQYADGSLALEAWDPFECEPYARLSVRMPGEAPVEGVFFLKDWSENSDIARAFRESGLIEPATDVEPRASGFIVARAWRFR